jgi:hypothetical protein
MRNSSKLNFPNMAGRFHRAITLADLDVPSKILRGHQNDVNRVHTDSPM